MAGSARLATREALAASDPTVKDGTHPRAVRNAWIDTVEKFETLGKALGLPRTTVVATAGVYFHRFYAVRSMKRNERALVCTAAMFLASKADETFRDLDTMTRHVYPAFSKEPGVAARIVREPAYLDSVKRNVLKAEHALLMAIGFDLNVANAHLVLVELDKKLHPGVPVAPDGSLRKATMGAAVCFVNDQLGHTNLCLQYQLPAIAHAAYLEAAKLKQYAIPLPEGCSSFAELVGAHPADLEGRCHAFFRHRAAPGRPVSGLTCASCRRFLSRRRPAHPAAA